MAKRIYRAGIIGCGRIAGMLDADPLRKKIMTHAAAYTNCERTTLVAAADIDKTRLRNFGKRWSVPRLYENYMDMLRQERLDILSICTHSDSHSEITKSALRSSPELKAIFCEKPIARTLKEAREMIKLCRRKGVILAVNHVRRWDSHFRKMKGMLDAGRIGEVRNVIFYYSGGLANNGAHIFDMLRFLFGDVKLIYAEQPHLAKSREKDLALSGRFHFKSNIPCFVVASNTEDYMMFELDVIGTKGRLKSLSNGEFLNLYKAGPSRKYTCDNELDEEPERIEVRENQRMIKAVKDIIDCMENGGQPACSGEDGYKALEIVGAFYESLNKKGFVCLPLKNKEQVIFSK